VGRLSTYCRNLENAVGRLSTHCWNLQNAVGRLSTNDCIATFCFMLITVTVHETTPSFGHSTSCVKKRIFVAFGRCLSCQQ
jgi:hypothetical protein